MRARPTRCGRGSRSSPTDVLARALLGITWLTITYRLVLRCRDCAGAAESAVRITDMRHPAHDLIEPCGPVAAPACGLPPGRPLGVPRASCAKPVAACARRSVL